MDRSKAITIRWTGEDGRPRRQVFEPRATGGHTRRTERWTGEEWVVEGAEIVARVGLEAPAAIIVDGSPTFAGASTSFRGP